MFVYRGYNFHIVDFADDCIWILLCEGETVSKKQKICIDEGQTKRLLTDTWKMARGDNTDICPTVEEMVRENVDPDIRLGRKGKKKAGKDAIDKAGDFISKKVIKKAGSWLDGFF